MNIYHNDQTLTIHNRYGCVWLGGLLFVMPNAMILLGMWGLFGDFSGASLIENIMIYLIVCGGLLGGIWIIQNTPRIMIQFDRLNHILTIQRGFIRMTTMRYPLSAIEELDLAQRPDQDGDLVFCPILHLRDGTTIELAAIWSPDQSGLQAKLNQIQAFLAE